MRHVLLRHVRRHAVHWDLLLDRPTGRLRTWSLPTPPTAAWQVAAELPPHRRLYLTHEGPVGGGRGFVRRWDAGPCRVLHEGDRRVVLALAGVRLCGVLELHRIADGHWRCRLRRNPG